MRDPVRILATCIATGVIFASSASAFWGSIGDNDNPGCDSLQLPGLWEMRGDDALWRFYRNGEISCEGSCVYSETGFSGEPIGYDLDAHGDEIQIQTSDGDYDNMSCTMVRGRVMKIETIGIFDRLSD